MNAAKAEYWTSTEGRALIDKVAAVAAETAFDAAATALRAGKKVTANPEQLRRAIEIVFTRRQAAFFGEWSKEGLFTRVTIEQASHPLIAAHHAEKFRGCQHVLEIGTGIGSDTAALAAVCKKVTSIEKSEVVAEMARHNLLCQGLSNVEVITGDATELRSIRAETKFDGLWADPARRDGSGNRLYDPEDWSPPLSFVFELKIDGPRGIKISPGFNLKELPGSAAREWLGLERECLEQTIWSGVSLADGTVFLADHNLTWTPPETATEAPLIALSELTNGWLVEPHAALIRSSHLSSFYSTGGLALLDRHIAYGGSKIEPPASLLYDKFKVLETFDFNIKTLNERIVARKWNSRTEIKKRGLSETADDLRGRLKFASGAKEKGFGIIFVTRIADAHCCILAERA